MKTERLKIYPLFAFRASPEDKAWLEEELDGVKKLVNRQRPEGTKVINKNDIIIAALKTGLEALKKEYKNR